MLYVIPFIVLLAILVFLKIREGKNKDQDKNVAAKKTTKKNNKSTASSSTAEQGAVETQNLLQPSTPEQNTVVDDAFKANIEKLIKARTFYSAEAKINQALNQDSSQHELYLYLVDIHLAQKDEFAIKQLINYVRSLGLHDIADRAEEKQRNYVPDTTLAAEPVEEPAQESVETEAPNQQKANKAFDALIIDSEIAAKSFDELQADLTGETKEASNEIKTIDFFASAETKPAPAAAVEPEVTPEEPSQPTTMLEFSFTEPAKTATENTSAEGEENVSFSTQSLDFNLSQPAQIEVESPEIQTEDFIFDEKIATEATPLGSDTTFKLDVGVPSEPETHQDADHSLEFNLDTPVSETPSHLSGHGTAVATSELVLDTAVTETTNEFSFDTQATETVPEFTLDTSAEEKTVSDLSFEESTLEQPVESLAPSDELHALPADTLAFDTQTSSDIETANDPLARSFPEVLDVNDIELNFDLAEKYIELGAYEAAKQLLTENESQYSDEQREHLQSLLNRIAS